MPTQEERLIALEQTTAEYRPVLQNITYELTIDQVGIRRELGLNMNDVQERLRRIEEQLNTILALLKPS